MSEHSIGPAQGNRKYEPSVVSIKQLFWLAVGVVSLVLVGVLVSAVTFKLFVKLTPMGSNATSFEDVRQLPRGLRLQTDAPGDLKNYRDEQEKVLSSYGWVDQSGGVVRIPIDRAMQLMLERGYPVRAGGETAAGSAKGTKKATPTGNHQAGSTSAGPEGKHS